MTRTVLMVTCAALLLSACDKKEQAKKAIVRIKAGPAKKSQPSPARKTPARPIKAPSEPKAFHPDYPTPRLAESEAIFLLEEPDRGPVIRAYEYLPEQGLKWTSHFHCESDLGRVVCGKVRPRGFIKSGGMGWQMGKRGGVPVVARKSFMGRTERTVALEGGVRGRPRHMILLDGRGVVRWSRHFNSEGTRFSARGRTGENKLKGCGYLTLTRDRKGRVSEATCTQWTGGPMKDARGVVRTRFKRDRYGLVLEELRLDEEGKPTVGDDGYHRRTVKRDLNGHPEEERFFDARGFPVMDANTGCHGWRIDTNALWVTRGKVCLGADGKPAPDNQNVCGYTYEYDGKACRVRQTNLMLQGKRCQRPSKQFVYTVDAFCGRLKRVCLTGKGKRVSCGTRQAAEFRYRRDDKGQVISTTHFKADLQPGKDTSCSAFEVRRTHDERGNEVSRSWFGVGDKPMDCWGTGFHRYVNEYDEAGRITRRRFLDVNGEPTTNLGCAVRKFTYDNYDHTVASEDRGSDGKLTAELGMATKRYIYDAGHRNFGMLLFDARGEAATYKGCFTGQRCTKKPWHALRITRKPNGAVDKNLFFDKSGQLIDAIDCDKELCWR